MALEFTEENHSYTSLETEIPIKWTSVTTFKKNFEEQFDALKSAERATKNRKSKWYKIPVPEILEVWENEGKRSSESGTWYHKKEEDFVSSFKEIEIDGKLIPVIVPTIKNGKTIAPSQKLTEGVYIEHLVYLKSAGLCGQSDRVEIVNGVVNIIDHKTNKEIKTEAYESWDGTRKRLSKPLHHLEDTDLVKFGLQLSLYMYMILKHNPTLKPGKLIIKHVIFKIKELDKYGYPILEVDEKGDFIVDRIVDYPVFYYLSEVREMIKYKLEVLDKHEQ